MKYLLLTLAVFSAASALQIPSKNFLEIEPALLGGTDSNWGQFPSAVIVDGPNEFCGGTILDARHILTAANCVLNSRFEIINPIYWKIIAGDIFFTPPSSSRVTRDVTRIFLHADYNPFSGANNLAILRLSSPLPAPHNTIEAARRQTRIVRDGFLCQLVGFGRISSSTDMAFRPRQVNLPQPIMNRDLCMSAFPHANRIEDSMICTQTNTQSTACSGSIGSGLYCDGFLTGVLSGGNFCNAAPAVYQQVRAFNQWIDATIRQVDDVRQIFTPFEGIRGFPRPISQS